MILADNQSPTAGQWAFRSKIWLEVEGRAVIGSGRMAMLESIHRNGSILNASREIGIPYRRVREAIQDMEEAVGRPLVIAYRGGSEGGGALLTDTAHELVASYNEIRDRFQREITIRFTEIIG
jgi:molybdate transport system regulatory protein